MIEVLFGVKFKNKYNKDDIFYTIFRIGKTLNHK